MKNSLKYIFFITIFALLGFSREFLFVNTNNQLFKLYYHNEDIKIPTSLDFLTHLEYSTLYYLKYVFTIIYFLAYLLASYFAIKHICLNKKYTMGYIYLRNIVSFVRYFHGLQLSN